MRFVFRAAQCPQQNVDRRDERPGAGGPFLANQGRVWRQPLGLRRRISPIRHFGRKVVANLR